MTIIYFNKDGYVCETYPLNIPVDETCEYIDIGDSEQTVGCVPAGFVWAVSEGHLVQVKYDTKVWTDSDRYTERQMLHSDTDSDYAKYSRQVRLGIDVEHSQATLDYIDAYNQEISNTVNQAGYPQEVVYPEYKLP